MGPNRQFRQVIPMNNFNFDERMSDIESSLSDLTNLKNNSNGLITVSEKLIKTIENSLIVAIYSLSEQLLKSTIYKLLNVEFDKDSQDAKDLFILKTMPLESHAMTPDIERIKREFQPYKDLNNINFNLISPKLIENYKESYIELIKARHRYAHANNHTESIDFKEAMEFVKFLRAVYYDCMNPGFIERLTEAIAEIEAFKIEKVNNWQTYSCKNKPSLNIVGLDTAFDAGMIETNISGNDGEENLFDIEPLNDIFDLIKEIEEEFDTIEEDNFDAKIVILKDKISKLRS